MILLIKEKYYPLGFNNEVKFKLYEFIRSWNPYIVNQYHHIKLITIILSIV